MRLSDHIKLPRSERQQHLDLSTPCILNNGSTKRGKVVKRALVAFLGLDNDVSNWREARVCVCHSCENNSTKGCCENPLHVSVGTVKENNSDIPPKVRRESASKAGRAAKEKGVGIHSPEVIGKGGRKAVEEGLGIHDPVVREETLRKQRRQIEVVEVKTGSITKFASLALAAAEIGVDCSTLSKVARGERGTTKGHTARYL